jgi:hypothetical protein
MVRQRSRLIDSLANVTCRRFLRTFLRVLETHPGFAESAGYNVYPRLYFSPLPLREEMNLTVLDSRRGLPGIDLNEQSALQLVQTLSAYVPEVDSVPTDRNSKDPFWFANDWFADFDAAILYALLRHLKPKRYVELGCGFSSLISSLALSANRKDGFDTEVLYADPQPRTDLTHYLAPGSLIQRRIQDLPLELFCSLRVGDVLFIDTSHVMKFQSDVVHALGTIIPSLKPGVWIHIHDVFTPYDYPLEWLTNALFADNEQYALEAMLSGGDRYSVELPLYLLWKEHLASMKAFFPRGQRQPGSFWMRKVHG